MKIKVAQEFKSIKSLNDAELPSFVIITGLNGAGKTQLLQAISSKKAFIEIDGKTASNTKMFSAGLGEIANNTFYGSKLERYCIALQNKISNYFHHKTNSPQLTYYNFDTFFTAAEKEIINTIKKNRPNKNEELIYVDRLEIMKNIPIGFIIDDSDKPQNQQNSQDLFQYDLSQIFKRYQLLYEQNDVNCYLRDIKGRTDVEALSSDDFLHKYGEPPWLLANEILASANLGYLLTTPEGQSSDEPFTVKLISQLNGLEISFFDLSSGEKVLMSLALALYSSHYDRICPEVLLLDEPDCHLHPSMAGKLLKVIEEVFVVHRKISVVMTTHSPSTVALAPETHLYAMTTEEGRIFKQTRDRCIKLLTTGVPALSIDYDNRVQVFVESKHDAKNYGDIYESIKDRLDNDISLNFIPSGAGGSGSCDQVRDIVNVLRRNGNSKIYGVIDWDGKNVESDFVKVAASGTRYSLENLIIDPLLLGIYLIRETHLRPEVCGLDSNLSYIRLANLNKIDCEKLASYVIKEVSNKLDINEDGITSTITYVGGLQISISNWILEMNGHALEESVKNTFHPLKRFRNENDLKSDIIRKVMTDFPQYVPYEFIDLFSSIQVQHLK